MGVSSSTPLPSISEKYASNTPHAITTTPFAYTNTALLALNSIESVSRKAIRFNANSDKAMRVTPRRYEKIIRDNKIFFMNYSF